MNRSFYALLVSQTATNLGFALYTMAVVLHLYNETGSTALSAAVTLISVISRMISNILLPSISDRFQPVNLLKFSQISQIVLIAGLMILFLQQMKDFMLMAIFLVLALISFFNGFFSPIKMSMVKAVVPKKQRVKANSLLSSVDQTFLFAGWTFGGILLAFLGKQSTLIITIILLVISILSLFLIKKSESPAVNSNFRMLSSLTAGWKILLQDKGLRVLIIMDLIEAWAGTIWIGAVTLTYVEDALGKGESWWGYINGGYYLGTIAGGILIYRLSYLLQGRLIIFMLIGSSAFGILTLGYGFISNPFLALLFVILMGPAYQLRDLAQTTMYQNSADETMLTKILAAKSVLNELIFVFSILGIGVLTDLIGVRLIYILSGILLIISSIFGFIQLKLQGKGNALEAEG
ncbi:MULTISPECIES: MFS transporter [Cytobacillus]|uniref:MFS transporter n=1 Tax=Cytobacillus TaxID=2675230 RepID=UPI002041B39D|nr:MFS transporter [Cytobacillus oceanisediminis]MBY0157953.1 MFS transporter [Cytobacillus firmus]MCM3395375.1 MFS transporter [Cytobacillus oceanisediminis]MCM3529446.1 MFS transporter [Cytobacillus oceanisediminis]USK44834.1 MFS transporter [Cytobacillus oceanisediminis]